MKKQILSLITISLFLFSSCSKNTMGDFKTEISTEETHITLASSDYSITESQPLTHRDDYEHYTSGIIEYKIDGNVVASVDYGNGIKDEYAAITERGVSSSLKLSKKDKKIIIKS